jgi:hypothetical protein
VAVFVDSWLSTLSVLSNETVLEPSLNVNGAVYWEKLPVSILNSMWEIQPQL